jgi:hypothetical protein
VGRADSRALQAQRRPTLVAESRRLTPTERLERLQKRFGFFEAAGRRAADAVAGPAGGSDPGVKDLLDLEEIAEIRRQSSG